MTDVIDHIICGGAGECIGEKTIVIWDHTALNVAVNLKHEGLIEELVKAGHKRKFAEGYVKRLGRRMQRFYDEVYEDLGDLGVPVEVYEPHSENLE